ncbi:ring -type zinc-finger protein [Ostreid herpesvirus 1]|uniref:RING-type domain-containing protein n=1 Tax=Ostreid herpesvirus 1 TaxID=261939 RepID=V9QLA8_OSHV1|nr:hypothetical protein [Ostreid herpesvirus 1]AHC31174.1 hypothetical protein [Ostreid herpesvirus 1]AHC31175.1 hypothetical protein [Ostreid herpesvirus 1]AHC31176.1 hypothetical protein [Ostreid herpesvirus 1]AHC31177.1 hypothetical protein [Ostreid herpesvirus 1]
MSTVKIISEEMCVACFDENVKLYIYDCGHKCCCKECFERVERCPMCRHLPVENIKPSTHVPAIPSAPSFELINMEVKTREIHPRSSRAKSIAKRMVYGMGPSFLDKLFDCKSGRDSMAWGKMCCICTKKTNDEMIKSKICESYYCRDCRDYLFQENGADQPLPFCPCCFKKYNGFEHVSAH